MRWAELVAMRCERVVENTWGLYPTVQLLLWINSSSLHSWKERKLWRMRRRPCSSASSGSPIFIFCIALTRPVSWDLYWTEINQKERGKYKPTVLCCAEFTSAMRLVIVIFTLFYGLQFANCFFCPKMKFMINICNLQTWKGVVLALVNFQLKLD